MENAKKRVFSAIQPSGQLTLGNYLGALKSWVEIQNEYDCIYSVADLHAITVRQEPAEFRRRILETYAILLARRGRSKKALCLYSRTFRPTASSPGYLLLSQFGEISRMTGFKDKAARHADNINVGLFSYPALMAADILLYQADFVPVGNDQKQHLEITRTIAERFNNAYSPTFTVPEPMIPKVCARVMSLQDPQSKMSKSDSNPNAFIALLDTPDDIIRKFKRAVTDSDTRVCVGEGKDGVNNLIAIYSAVTGYSAEEIENRFEGKGYGEFKLAVGEAVAEHLRPVREKFEYLMNNKDSLEALYREAATRAEGIAVKTLSKVMRKMGYIR